jgi:hypothetical protein
VNVVVARLIGGLGNQMFQYAAGRALALRCGATLRLDLSGFATYPKRRYELGDFPICATAASEADLARFGLRPEAQFGWRRRVRGLLPFKAKPWASPTYRERHFHFDARVVDLRAPIYLDGFWQTERYFSDFADTLRLEFCPAAPLESENAAVAAQIDATSAVSLHVRRGDYVDEADINRFHGVCSLGYFRAAVQYFHERVGSIHLFVFSDDQGWSRRNLLLGLPTTFVDANSSNRGFRDMQLMARCSHHIIANSSFSWWGAWLNPSPAKIVVAPRRWFGASTNDTRDLLPEAWVRL